MLSSSQHKTCRKFSQAPIVNNVQPTVKNIDISSSVTYSNGNATPTNNNNGGKKMLHP
jgi:hypothetical protein